MKSTRYVMARSLTAGFLLMLLCTQSGKAACRDWSRHIGRVSYSTIYQGKIGDHPARVRLHLVVVTGRFDGVYGYNDQPGVLILTGTMQPGGVGIDLVERDELGHVTGYFRLTFLHHPPPSWNKNGRFPSEDCEDLTGNWRSASGNETQEVTIHSVGELNPAYDEQRERNEVTAYKLREAMLNGDRKSFASLLHYPFHMDYVSQMGSSTWNTRGDVVKSYDNMIPFSRDQIRDSVPHILETVGPRSFFMNGSVYITNGKVNLICDGACPVIPVGVDH